MTQLENELCLGSGGFGGEGCRLGVSGRMRMHRWWQGVTWGMSGRGGGGSPYMRGLAEHFFLIFNRNVFDFFKVQVLFISY